MKIQELFKMFDDRKFWIVFLDILFIISPGFFLLFVFQETLFRELDTLKLVILSISITGPLYVINILLGAYFSKNKIIHFNNYSYAILMSGFILYLSFFAFYTINKFVLEISFFWFIIILLFIEIIHIFEDYRENKN